MRERRVIEYMYTSFVSFFGFFARTIYGFMRAFDVA